MLWIDLDNSPHVPFFRPIIAELGRRQAPYVITAREYAQTVDLLKLWKIPHILVGQHAGKSKVRKVMNLLQRSMALARVVRPHHVSLAVSHGSRTQSMAAWRLRIAAVMILDYEYAEPFVRNLFADYMLIPAFIPNERLKENGFRLERVIRFNGFKEQMYLEHFVPDLSFRKTLGIPEDVTLVTMRPPSTTSNYHDSRSEELFKMCLEHFSSHAHVHCLITNRTAAEQRLFPADLVGRPNISFLKNAVDGLQLIWNSDLFISGGGTMNRESALLGVPTFSIFTGRPPYLDEYLQEMGKLRFLHTREAITSVPVVKRRIASSYVPDKTGLAGEIVDILMEIKSRNRPS